jgi:hypothetical protein
MRHKHIGFLAAGLLCGLAATVTAAAPSPTTVAVEGDTVQVTLSPSDRLISLEDMVIGDSTSAVLRIENSGNATANLRLTGLLASETTPAPTPALADKLMLSVHKTTGTQTTRVFPAAGSPKSTASLREFNQLGADLGYFDRPCQFDPGKACDSSGRPSKWSTGHRASLTFRVQLAGIGAGTADNALRLLKANENFNITATKATSGGSTR